MISLREMPHYPVTPFIGFSDPFSSLLHLIAAAVCLWFGIKLLYDFKSPLGARISLGVFVFGAVFMFSMSGVYHLLDQGGTPRYVMQHLDHAAIWIMIAGTFTPIHVILFTGWKRWGVLGFVWTAAITGLVLKTVFFDEFPEWLGLIFYLGLGWVGVFSGIMLAKQKEWHDVRLMGYGGIAYSLGAVFEFFRPPFFIQGVIGPHEIFHIAIIFGAYYHWTFIVQHADVKLNALRLNESE